MSSFCATCGRSRSGTAQFCDGCGAEFTDPPAASEDRGAPPDATRADPAFGATRLDLPGSEPDPFASWYQPERPGGMPGVAPRGADETWEPTQTVGVAPTRPAGFPPPPPGQPVPPPPPYQPFPPPTGPSRRGRGGLYVAIAAIVVLAAGGGAYAIASSLGKHSATQPPSPPSTMSGTPATGTSASGTATGTSASGTPASGSPSSGGPQQASSQSPSPALSLVRIDPGVTPSAAQPQVETLLSHYFHGINAHDYAEYASTLNPAQQAKQSRVTFSSGYATTTDSAMTLTSLANGAAGGLVATVTFTSHQSPAQSVDHSACNTWTLNFYLVPQGTGYLIGPAPSGYTPSHSDC